MEAAALMASLPGNVGFIFIALLSVAHPVKG
jgi:hypothetical protein